MIIILILSEVHIIMNIDIFKDYPDVVTPSDLQVMLNIGRNTVYTILQEGLIRTIKVGKKYIIPKQNVIDFLRNNI